MLLEVNNNNFEEILKSDLPVLMDVGATWCGPCKALAPIVEELSGEYDGKMLFAKVDVDEASDIAAKYRIRNVPTVLFIKNGEVVDKSVGLVAKATLEEKIKSLI